MAGHLALNRSAHPVVPATALVLLLLAPVAPAQASSGVWERTWGKDVDIDTGRGFEICTVAAECVVGGPGGLGGEMSAPAGVATDADGNIYVVDRDSHRIQKFDAAGGFLLTWGKDVDAVAPDTGFEICTQPADCKAAAVSTGLGGEMDSPGGVGVDTAGSLYVADVGNHRIQKFDSDGNFLSAWGKDVVEDGGTRFEICTEAAVCKTGSSGGLGGEMNAPIAVAADGYGHVYVADLNNNRIQKLDTEGSFLGAWGTDVDAVEAGTGFEVCTEPADCKAAAVSTGLGGEMNNPVGVATDEAGNVYIAGYSDHRIQKLDSRGGFLAAWGKDVVTAGGTGYEVCTSAADCKAGVMGALGGEMSTPYGIGIDAAGDVYVAELGNSRIQKLDAAGTFLRAWGRDVDSVVADTGFEICEAAAACQAAAASTGLGGEMDRPLGVAAASAGGVYVADLGNLRIQRFEVSGEFSLAWGKAGTGTDFEICTVAADCRAASDDFTGLGGQMSEPTNVGGDESGNVYIAEFGRIQKFDSAGTFLLAWGKDVDGAAASTGFEICTVAANCKQPAVGTGLGGEMEWVSGIGTDAAGNVYVLELGNERVQKFTSQGTFLLAWGMDVDGVATGTGFEICMVAANCKAAADSTGLGGEMNTPRGMGVDAAGNVYVADNRDRIQKFDSSGTFLRTWGKDVIGAGRTGDTGTGFEICTVIADCTNGGFGELGGEVVDPKGIGIDGAANVYVADQGNERVQKFDSEGNFLLAWAKDVDSAPGAADICTVAADCRRGTSGVLGGEMSGPYGVAADAAGNVYVTDLDNPRVQKFDSGGVFLLAWGKDVDSAAGTGFEICTVAANCQPGGRGVLGGEMDNFIGLGIGTDANGNVYVADTMSNRIQKFAGDRANAVDDSASVAEDSDENGIAVLANDADPDGGPMAIMSKTNPANGAVTITGVADLSYTPDSNYCNDPSAAPADTFTYTLNGGSTATVSVTVSCVADDPTAVNDSATVAEDSGSNAIDVLANDTDPDGGPKSVQSSSDPANGTVAIAGGGTGVTYTPDANYCNNPGAAPEDTFTYTLNGGSIATVSVTVACVDELAPPDTTPPNTAISKARINRTKHKATFRFFSTEPGSTFLCKIDKKPFRACSSPKTYKNLKVGKHKFQVKAKDAAGNIDASPAVKKFRI